MSIAQCEHKLELLSDRSGLDQREAELRKECDDLETKMTECVRQNARFALNQEEYQKRYDKLIVLRDTAKEKLAAVILEKQEASTHREKLRHFIETLSPKDTPLSDFDEQLWRNTVETVTVHATDNIVVRFISGTEIRVRADE